MTERTQFRFGLVGYGESLGLKDHFKGVVPATYQAALDAMVEKAGLKAVKPN